MLVSIPSSKVLSFSNSNVLGDMGVAPPDARLFGKYVRMRSSSEPFVEAIIFGMSLVANMAASHLLRCKSTVPETKPAKANIGANMSKLSARSFSARMDLRVSIVVLASKNYFFSKNKACHDNK